jgi:hypothetical protein
MRVTELAWDKLLFNKTDASENLFANFMQNEELEFSRTGYSSLLGYELSVAG